MPIAVVFSVSFAALAFEVLLTRIFSVALSHHLTYMVISIALFGFAAAGTLLSIMESRSQNRGQSRPQNRNQSRTWGKVEKSGWVKKWGTTLGFSILGAGYTISAVLVLLLISRLPLDFLRLPVEPIQAIYLMLAYFLPAIPFFIAGFTISLAYACHSERAGRIYFANMAGSALGAVFPALLLPFMAEERLTLITACAPLALSLFSIPLLHSSRLSNKVHQIVLGGMGICLIIVLFMPWTHSLFRIHPSSYKNLSQIRQYPHTRVIRSDNGIRGRIETVESPYLRYAPGLSLTWTEPVSARKALFNDGDGRLVLYEPSLDKARRWAPFTLAWAGYQLVDNPNHILLLIRNGGAAMACAAAANPKALTIVLDSPAMADIMGAHYGHWIEASSMAGFLSRTKQKYDLIHIENGGSDLSGMIATIQDPTFTTDQLKRCLSHLTERGVLVLTRRLKLPPSDMLRLWASVYSALSEQGLKTPANHLAILRNWDHFTLIVSAPPLKTKVLRKFASERNFDLVFLPHILPEDANRFNRFDQPFHYLEIQRLADAYRFSIPESFFDTYLLDVKPQSDQRPFPNRFLKWSRIKEIYKAAGSRLYSLFLSDEIVVLAVLIQAILVSIALLLLPRMLHRDVSPLRARRSGFFLCLGAGFILYEMYFIKAYTFILGDPLISFTIVLTGVLIFSGIGGIVSQRLSLKKLELFLGALIATLLTIYFCHDLWTKGLLALSFFSRYTAAFLLLIPAGLLSGLAFPAAMRDMLESPTQRANAWAANGCASVVSAVAAAQMALLAGIPVLILAAVAVYTLALALLHKSNAPAI